QRFLETGGRFPPYRDPKSDVPDKGPGELVPNVAFQTIRPDLKALLETMETRPDEKDKVLYAMAGELEKFRITDNGPGRGDFWWLRLNTIWDLSMVLEERRPRVRLLGAGLVRRGEQKFLYRNELVCNQESDARELLDTLVEKSSPKVAEF